MTRENGIGSGVVCLEDIRQDLEQRTLNSIRKVLPDAAIIEACRGVGHLWRRRLVTPVVTVLHMILAAIWPEESFAASWQVLWDATASRLVGAAGRSPRCSSVTKARARLPLELWRRLFEWLSQKAQELSANFDKWRTHRVVLLDGTCVSMGDTRELFEAFGRCKSRHRQSKYPLARLATAALANTMTVIAYRLGRYRDSETTLAMGLLGRLSKGDLVVGDRHFAGANLYCCYLREGLEFLTRVHQKLKVSRLRRLVSYGEGDFVTHLRVNSAYRREDPTLPKKVKVRLIRVVLRIRGKRKVTWLVTSLLDAGAYPAREVAQLYARRWRIEDLFREIKVNMSADVLRSKSAEGIRKEVAARVSAVNIVRMIMVEAAGEHGVDPLRISFTHATRAIVVFAHALGCAPAWKLPTIYKAMLAEIAAHTVPERPGRNEPRAVRREQKHYPTLRTTRKAWRLANAA